MFEIKLIEYASETIKVIARNMDHATFQRSDWITDEDAALIYSRKNCIIWLTTDQEPSGYITIVPINNQLPNISINTNKPIYKLLTKANLNEVGKGVLYCHCILILPKFRGQGLIYHLYEGLKTWLEQNGSTYSDIYADAISIEGRKSLERIGFQPIHAMPGMGTLYFSERTNVINTIERLLQANRYK